MALNIPEFTLNNGTKIPSVGLGCWMGAPGGEQRVYDMCEKALKMGYRHFDTAAGYGNEKEVGRALRDSGIPRSQIYLTTKLGSTHHAVRESFDKSLKNLDCEYIDLYLMHWPQTLDPQDDKKFLQPDQYPTIIDTWKEMEKLLDTGLVKSIGVSNFSIKTLEQLLPACTVIPATNQVEVHPCLPQNDLKVYCEEKGILLTAYSPLGRSSPLILDAPATKKVTLAHRDATSAQVLLSWGVQRHTIVIPKSENDERMRANITLVELTEEEMKELDAIHTSGPELHRSLLSFHNNSADGTVFGWTYEQLGWDMVKGGIVASK